MENDELFNVDSITGIGLSDQGDFNNSDTVDLPQGDEVPSYSVDLQSIIDRLDTIELLLSEPVTQVNESPVRVFNSLDQALLFMILVVASCIFLFRGKN